MATNTSLPLLLSLRFCVTQGSLADMRTFTTLESQGDTYTYITPIT